MAPLGPFGEVPRLAVGVSGGPHSLALALLAQDFAQARGGDALALVVDHGLRAESGAEAEWTLRTLAAQGIAARRLTLALPPGPAVQERARRARLATLLDACAAWGRPWLLLGQHRLDQAETLLFRALRGSGPAGLAGMSALRPAAEALILRPLLGMPPARLEALLRHRGLEPLRDPSNADPRFTRVRLRAALRDPEGTGPGTAALDAAAAAFARRRSRREAAMAARLAGAVTLHPEGWARLDHAALGRDAVARAALAALLRLLAGAEHAPAAAAVAALLERGQGTLHGVVWKDGLLCREPAACAPPVPALRDALWDGRWRLLAPPAGPALRWGALGAAATGLDRAARRDLPTRVLAGLPALWRDDCLAGVPCLGFGIAADALFAPAGGPLCP
ncbi:tRNA lysidine(34) synthetase TilS [Roseomonas sp. E05]|uniref:tRNA lysidine(34) synthetase TilS n=1 Tax=Roseomonas sp. E05 TaxID=3046310 RepID=UPI0024BBBAFC|nr:tRNA lysidine(34) synthetase TilS [Roseomonas sp. E05]MDJ0389888.1 tRNA lysidine(34) synthetase TilS [Roseomonas sp. E05]